MQLVGELDLLQEELGRVQLWETATFVVNVLL